MNIRDFFPFSRKEGIELREILLEINNNNKILREERKKEKEAYEETITFQNKALESTLIKLESTLEDNRTLIKSHKEIDLKLERYESKVDDLKNKGSLKLEKIKESLSTNGTDNIRKIDELEKRIYSKLDENSEKLHNNISNFEERNQKSYSSLIKMNGEYENLIKSILNHEEQVIKLCNDLKTELNQSNEKLRVNEEKASLKLNELTVTVLEKTEENKNEILKGLGDNIFKEKQKNYQKYNELKDKSSETSNSINGILDLMNKLLFKDLLKNHKKEVEKIIKS